MPPARARPDWPRASRRSFLLPLFDAPLLSRGIVALIGRIFQRLLREGSQRGSCQSWQRHVRARVVQARESARVRASQRTPWFVDGARYEPYWNIDERM